MKKQIVSETKNYQPSTVDELLLDDAPKVNSFNGITSDGVARAIAGASGEVPQVTENDNGKVLTAIYDEGGPAVEWAEAQGGGSVTTVDKAFTVGVNGTGLPITVDCANASETTSPRHVEVAGVAGYNIMANSDSVFFALPGLDLTNTVTITFPEDLGNASASGSFLQSVAWYKGAPDAVTNLDMSLFLSPTNQDGNVLKAGTYLVTGYAPFLFTPDGVCLTYSGEGEAVTQIKADIAAAASSLTLSTTASAVTGYTIKPSVLPDSAVGDAGKVLTVNAQGTPAWATAGGGSSYTAGDGININNNEISVRAGDGLELGTFTGALKVSNPLPASNVSDAGKILTVNSSGNPEWATPSGGSSSAFNTTFDLIDDGTHECWRAASIDSEDTIDLQYGDGVYAYRVNAKIDVSAAVDDVYNIEVRVGTVLNSRNDYKAIGLQSNSDNYLTFNTSGILNIVSGTGISKSQIFVKVTPAKSSGASTAVFTGGNFTLMLAKL